MDQEGERDADASEDDSPLLLFTRTYLAADATRDEGLSEAAADVLVRDAQLNDATETASS